MKAFYKLQCFSVPIKRFFQTIRRPQRLFHPAKIKFLGGNTKYLKFQWRLLFQGTRMVKFKDLEYLHKIKVIGSFCPTSVSAFKNWSSAYLEYTLKIIPCLQKSRSINVLWSEHCCCVELWELIGQIPGLVWCNIFACCYRSKMSQPVS